MLQIFDKISNWNLNKEKLRLEVDKLRREEITTKREEIEIYSDQQWPGNIEIESREIEEKLINRLVEMNIKPREIEIREHKDNEG